MDATVLEPLMEPLCCVFLTGESREDVGGARTLERSGVSVSSWVKSMLPLSLACAFLLDLSLGV